MLRVTVEVVPLGDEDQKKVLGVIRIGNDATGTHEYGNYVVRHGVGKWRVEGHRRSDGWLSLVARALRALEVDDE